MNHRPVKNLILVLSIVLGSGAVSEKAKAEGYQAHASQMGANVYDLNQLANDMEFRYQWELRFCHGCKDSLTLLKRIQNHAHLTKDLVRAWRGKCGKTFEAVACDVHGSIIQIQNLSKKSRISDSVSSMIDQSAPQAIYVHAHSNHFQPTTRRSSFRLGWR